MACPYFLPGRRMADSKDVPGWKMPLGGVFDGECRLPELPAWKPPEERLRQCCNTGYPAGCCERFPANSPFDLIRLLIVEEGDRSAKLLYVYEKDHQPAGKGELTVPAGGGVLETQAETYWNSYLERKCKGIP